MFSVIAMKSRTFFCFSYSANEQVCRSWEGAQPGSQSKLANGNIPCHRCYAEFINGRCLQDRNLFFSPAVQTFPQILSFCRAWNPWASGNLRVPRLLLGDFLHNWLSGSEKIVLCIVCFAYSLVVIVFPLLSYETACISTRVFSLLSISPLQPTGGKEEGWASGCLALSCQLPG